MTGTPVKTGGKGPAIDHRRGSVHRKRSLSKRGELQALADWFCEDDDDEGGVTHLPLHPSFRPKKQILDLIDDMPEILVITIPEVSFLGCFFQYKTMFLSKLL